MPLKHTDHAGEWEEVDRYDAGPDAGGVGWIAHPGETMQRASHALVEDGEVWVIDPVDVPDLDELLAAEGEVAGVVILLDRHRRDAAAIAERHDVSVHLPFPLDGIADEIDAPVETFRHDLGDTSYAAHPVVDRYVWHEAVLYSDETGVLVVPESLGTAPYFRVGEERVGVHPMLRAMPPKKLARLSPDHLLCGHGAGLHVDAASAVEYALDGARRRLPALYWQNLKGMIGG